MRSINALAFTSAIALLLIATFSVAPVKAAHGELKVRQSTERENIKTWWDRFFQDIKNSEGSEVEVKVVNPTTTATYTLYPGRKGLAATTSSSKTSSRSTSTTRRTTSTSTRRTSTSTKPATTSTKPATTSTKPAATTSKTSSTAAATNTAGLSSFASNILKAHNDARAPRGANALTWSTEAEAAAKAWGDKCVWQHGGASGMGQNLAASAGYKQTGQQVVDAWMSEEKDYNPSNPTYSHFTQVVWKSTTQVGCYQSTCNKLYNPDGSETFPGFSPSYYTVCNYKPPGNYAGQYAANVQKL